MNFKDMTREQQVSVLMQDDRKQLLADCRKMGISAHKIQDKKVLCEMMVTKMRYIHAHWS